MKYASRISFFLMFFVFQAYNAFGASFPTTGYQGETGGTAESELQEFQAGVSSTSMLGSSTYHFDSDFGNPATTYDYLLDQHPVYTLTSGALLQAGDIIDTGTGTYTLKYSPIYGYLWADFGKDDELGAAEELFELPISDCLYPLSLLSLVYGCFLLYRRRKQTLIKI